MKLKELREVNDILHDLWDFFTSNADGDETGLVEEMSQKYEIVHNIIHKEFESLHKRNAIKKIKLEIKKRGIKL